MARKEKRMDESPVEEVPEVAAFMEVQQRLQAFRESNPDLFRYLDELTEEYNEKWEAAKKATQARGITCGEFVKYQEAETVDWEALYQGLGHDEFLAVGGKVSTKQVLEGEKKRVLSNIASGRIPRDLGELVVKKTPRYHRPEKALMP